MRGFLAASMITLLALPVPGAGAEEGFVIERFPQPHPATWFVDTYGAARRGHRHQGIDLMGEKLMPVVAVADGVVERMAEHRTAGYYVIVGHEGGWQSHYMHLNDDTPGTDDGRGGPEHAFAPGLEEGDFVRAGDLLGWVGDSGNAEWTLPHTHFELHAPGRGVINPYPYLVVAWREFLVEWLTRAAPTRVQ